MRVRMYVVARVEGCNYILYTKILLMGMARCEKQRGEGEGEGSKVKYFIELMVL